MTLTMPHALEAQFVQDRRGDRWHCPCCRSRVARVVIDESPDEAKTSSYLEGLDLDSVMAWHKAGAVPLSSKRATLQLEPGFVFISSREAWGKPRQQLAPGVGAGNREHRQFHLRRIEDAQSRGNLAEVLEETKAMLAQMREYEALDTATGHVLNRQEAPGAGHAVRIECAAPGCRKILLIKSIRSVLK